MEFAGGGDLAGYLKKHKALKESLASVWFKQTSEAVHYLHTVPRMAHRDIKLDNILLDDTNHTKLTDFGFANLITDESMDVYAAVSDTFCGTAPYYSPQLVAKKPYNPFKADCWAMGVVVYAMLCNRYLFHFKDAKIMYREQTNYPEYIRGRFNEPISELARDLIEFIVQPDEKQRPTMADILAHEWLGGTMTTKTNSTTSVASNSSNADD